MDCPIEPLKVDLTDEIRGVFERFGEVSEVALPSSKDGGNKGFAFVRFRETSAVAAIMTSTSGLILRAKHVS